MNIIRLNFSIAIFLSVITLRSSLASAPPVDDEPPSAAEELISHSHAVFKRFSNFTALFGPEVSDRLKFCIDDVDAEWKLAFDFSKRTQFLSACMRKLKDGLLITEEENENALSTEGNSENLHTEQGIINYGPNDKQTKASDATHEMGAGAGAGSNTRDHKEIITDVYTSDELEEIATLDELRRSRRTRKKPTWMSSYIKGKKGKGRNRK